MANTRISDLTASASNLASTDLAPVVQTAGVGPVKMTGAQIAAGLLSATTPIGSGPILSRGGSATLQLGAADAAAPVAQTFKVQGVVAGTTNTAGANFTIQGSQGTGNAAGGSIIFQVAPAGSSGTAQNAYSTTLTIGNVSGNGWGSYAYTPNGTNWLFVGGDGNNYPGVYTSTGAFVVRTAQYTNMFSVNTVGIHINAAAGVLSFGGGYSTNTSGDVILARDAANTLALRNGTNAQKFRVYNTFTSSTNYETFKIDWITTANTCLIGTEKGSGGGTARALAFQTDGTTRLTIATDGIITTASALDISTGGRLTVGGNTFQIQAVGSNSLRLLSGTSTFIFGPADSTPVTAQTIRVQNGTGTNTAGATWTRIGSLGTGTAAAGNIVEQTGFSGSSGTTAHTAVDREIIVAQGKTLTDNTATSLFEIALPTLAMAGGVIEATVICTDGTDMQSVTETITYAAVNKGGVYTKDVDVQTTSSAVSAGTITNTWAFLDGTNKVTMQVTSDTSLTPTKFLVYYKVRNNSEQATTIL